MRKVLMVSWFRRRLASLFGNFLLLTMGTISACLLSEGLIRVFYTVPPREMNFFNLRTSSYYYKHDRLGWLPRKNINGIHGQPGSFITNFRTNSRGLRDKEYRLDKPIDRRRVVVLGDSFTWGWGVNDDEIYSEVMETLLDHTDVINLGVTAFNIRQEFEYLKLEGMLYSPDLVVLALCMNDIGDTSIPNSNSIRAESKVPSNEDNSPFLRTKVFLRDHSALYNFVMDRINTDKRLIKFLTRIGLKGRLGGYEQLDGNLRPALRSYPTELERQWKSVTSLLLEMRAFLQEQKVRFIVALIPSKQSVDEKVFHDSIAYTIYDPEDFDLTKPYKLLEDFGRAHQIEIINPLSAFRRKHIPKVRLFLNTDMHFNKAGHEVFAREISEYIRHTKKAH